MALGAYARVPTTFRPPTTFPEAMDQTIHSYYAHMDVCQPGRAGADGGAGGSKLWPWCARPVHATGAYKAAVVARTLPKLNFPYQLLKSKRE